MFNLSELFVLFTPFFYIVVEATNCLKSSRFWVSRAQSEDALQLSKVPDFRHIISLSKPIGKGRVILVKGPPFFIGPFFHIGPPPGMDIEVVKRR